MKSRELDSESLARLLRWLDEDPNQAGEKYVKIQRRLSEFFALRRCSEDLADETIDRVARKLKEEAVIAEAPAAYFFGVARFVALESYRNPERNFTPLDEFGADRFIAEQFPPPEPDDPLFECLEKCLAKLSPGKRDLILDYYQADNPVMKKSGLLKRARIELRARLGMSERAMNAKTGRIREWLKRCVEQCLDQFHPQQNI